jgi:hypothetical protein
MTAAAAACRAAEQSKKRPLSDKGQCLLFQFKPFFIAYGKLGLIHLNEITGGGKSRTFRKLERVPQPSKTHAKL